MLEPSHVVAGALHAVVAFDWGDEVNLEHARKLAPADFLTLARRPRTPSSIAYRPSPLRFKLPAAPLELSSLGKVELHAEATVFDFAAVSVSLRIPFEMPAGDLTRLAGSLSESEPIVQFARRASEALYRHLLPAIERPEWSDLSEEYFVFQFAPDGALPAPETLLADSREWLAGLLRLEAGALSKEEIDESLRLRLSYSPHDLLILEWSAAVLIDRDCEETLQTIEFANLQLLEFRHTDDRLDDQLTAAYSLVHRTPRRWRLPWRTHSQALRAVGDLKIEANAVVERTSNVLKLVGDQYLARLYSMLASKFHLEEWTQSIHRSLAVAESVYQFLSDEAARHRTELLELTVIFLIAFEIVMAWVRG